MCSTFWGCTHSPSMERVNMETLRIVNRPDTLDGLDVYDAEALWKRGLDLVEGGRFAEALRYYERILKEFPESTYVRPARFQQAHCFVELQDGAAALKAIDAYLASLPKELPENFRWEGLFTRGQALGLLKRYQEAADLYDLLMVEELDVVKHIEASVNSGVCHFMLGDHVTAEYRFRRAHRAHREASDIERLQTKYFSSQASFYLAEIARHEFENYRLVFPNTETLTEDAELERTLGAELEEKCQRLLRAQAAYTKAVRDGHTGWASAAGHQVGDMYESLYQELITLPPPDNFTATQRSIYRKMLRERVLILLEKAISVWEATTKMATRTGEQNEWVDKSHERIQRIKALLLAESNKEPSESFEDIEIPAAKM